MNCITGWEIGLLLYINNYYLMQCITEISTTTLNLDKITCKPQSWVDYCFNMAFYFWRHFTDLNDYECEHSKLHFSCKSAYFHAWWVPEGCRQHRVGCLDHLSLWCDTREVALMQGGVQPSFKRSVHVGKCHQVLGFLWGWKNRAVRLRI